MPSSLPLLLAAALGAAVMYGVQQLQASSGRRRRRGQAPADGDACAAADGDVSRPGGLWQPAPHPNWRPPQKQPAPFDTDEMRTVDPALMPSDALYPLVISAVVPRPIGFLSTQSAAGAGNLAPYSYFNVMSHSPPTVAVGCATSRLRPHGRKDTLVNILETGEFVVNIMSEWFVEAANHCCGNFDYGEDEMALSGLTPLPSVKVRPRRVKESALHMECVLRATHEVTDAAGKVTGVVVIGEVVLLHVHEGVAGTSPSGKLVVDVEKFRPICRLGGNTYGRVSGLFDLPRPDRGPPPAQAALAYTSTPA